HRRIVDIGIELVAVLEVPPARLDARPPDLPVSRVSDFPFEKPVDRAGDWGFVLGLARIREGDRGDGRVPDRRDAGLHPSATSFVDPQVVELPPGPSH